MTQHIVSCVGARLPFPQFQRKVEISPMIQSIIKRDGRVVLYDQNKIASAILRALEASREGDAADAADAHTFGFHEFRNTEGDWGYWMCFLERNS